jgi:hypothetical protein
MNDHPPTFGHTMGIAPRQGGNTTLISPLSAPVFASASCASLAENQSVAFGA